MNARRLYQDFLGKVSRRMLQVGIKYGSRWLTKQCRLNILIPDEIGIIGHVRALEYDCVRDGKLIIARHPFAPGSRPVFAVGPCRGQLFLIGTHFQFTDRGIVDFNTRGEAVDYNEKTDQVKKLD